MNTKLTLIISLSLAIFAACSGGSSEPTLTPGTGPVGGIGRTGFSHGPVSTFGSIVVNGVRYDTSGATFNVNDAAATEADLAVGDVVTVKGTINSDGQTGTAEEVTFDDVVTGPVDSVDVPLSMLTVLGQTVIVGPDTSFDDSFANPSLAGVTIGQIVEVSGQIDANGDVVATRIEPKPAGSQFEVHGTVENLDSTNMTFQLAALTVDYSAAMLDNFPGGQISNGDFVEAKGMSFNASNQLAATSVELESFLPGIVDGDGAEIEGFITRFSSSQDFDVAGFPVTTTASTVFEGGTSGDLGLNIKVEVEGQVDAQGILIASKVDIRRAKAVRATANLDSVDAATSSVVLLGITVSIDALTRIEDKSNADVSPLTVADLNIGDYVEVRGDEFPAGSGEILATIFEREDPDTEASLQGFVETIADPSFTILGVTIETDGGTVFRDENDAVITANEFFNRLANNNLVKAEGIESGDTTIDAQEVEFEIEF